MNDIWNAQRIEQTIRLTRATIEMMLGMDKDVKALMGVTGQNLEEANRNMLDVIERKVKSVVETKLK